MDYSGGKELLGPSVRSHLHGVPETPLPFDELRNRVLNLPLVQNYSFGEERLKTLQLEYEHSNLENVLDYAIGMLQYSSDFELVLEIFQTWHSMGNLNGIGLMFYANLCQFAFHDFVKAKFLYEASSKFDPKNPITWRLLSSMLYREFHDEETYNQILGKYRNTPCDNHIQYVAALLRFLLNFMKTDTKAAYTAAVLVKKYIKDKNMAKFLYLQSIYIDRNNALSHFNVGLIYDNASSWRQAKHHYRECLLIDPTKHDAWFNYGGVVQESENDTERSLRMFEKASSGKPDEALYCATIAETYHFWVSTPNLEKAEEFYLKAISLQDEHRSRVNLAKLYKDRLEYAKALEIIVPAFSMEKDKNILQSDSKLLKWIISNLPHTSTRNEWMDHLGKYNSLETADIDNNTLIDTWLSLPTCLRRALPAEKPDLHKKLSKLACDHYSLIFPLLENTLLDVGADLVIDFITGDWIGNKRESV